MREERAEQGRYLNLLLYHRCNRGKLVSSHHAQLDKDVFVWIQIDSVTMEKRHGLMNSIDCFHRVTLSVMLIHMKSSYQKSISGQVFYIYNRGYAPGHVFVKLYATDADVLVRYGCIVDVEDARRVRYCAC